MKVNEHWHPETIKAEIRRRGFALNDIDRRYRLPLRTCAHALYQPGPRGEKAIARFLGIPAATLWPSRYDAQGRRLKPQPATNWQHVPWREQARAAA
jgi:Ner family transcriptional regulator